jgi:glycosyltransferase involved in cell wall biosynthesis
LVSSVNFLIQRFPGYGGAEEYVLHLTEYLAKSGVKCTIFTSNIDTRQISSLPKSVEIFRFPVMLKVGEYAVWRGLCKALLKNDADVLHINTYGYFHTDLASFIHRIKGFPTVLTSHGFHGLDAFLNRSWNGTPKSLLRQTLVGLRPIYDFTLGSKEITSSDALIALSNHDIEIYKWLGADQRKIFEVYLGVKDVYFEKNKLDKTSFQQQNGPLILSVGELSWVKGKDIPLRAFAKLSRDYPTAKLVYVGKDGGMYAYLKDLMAKFGLERKVVFLGYIPPEELAGLYGLADVLVHTSYAEGLSTVILEALASGVPVVSTPAGGNAQLLKDSGAGIVIPFNNADSAYTAIDKILRDDSLREFFKSNGRDFAEKNFRWKDVAAKHLSLYRKISKSG